MGKTIWSHWREPLTVRDDALRLRVHLAQEILDGVAVRSQQPGTNIIKHLPVTVTAAISVVVLMGAGALQKALPL